MRVMHVLKHGMKNNGHVNVAVDLACTQSANGDTVAFMASETSFEELFDVSRVEFLPLAMKRSPAGLVEATTSVWRTVARWNPDIVHVHMMSSAVLVYPVTRRHRIPVVATMHNSFDRSSVLMRLADVVVAVSEAERQLLLNRGYNKRKLQMIFNGPIDSPRERYATENRLLRRPSLVSLSGLHRRKAVSDVIEAFCQASGAFPDWRLSIVGEGPDLESLQLQAYQLGIQNKVSFLGSTSKASALLRQADLFTTATLADPCPLTVMEARGAACAIVATEVGGIPEALDFGDAGVLVAPNRPDALADELVKLMGDASLRTSFSGRAAQGRDRFTVQRMTKDYDKLYVNLIRQRHS